MSNLQTFLQAFQADQAPQAIRHQARRCLMDTIAVGYGGASTPLSGIIFEYSAEIHSGLQPLAYDGRGVNPVGQALAFGMTIDSLDGHDGYNPAKGHVGAGLIPGLLALGTHFSCDGKAFETALIAGYEAASRLAVALHGSVPDYHTSGAWVAVAIAAAGGRMVGLSEEQIAHAMGIAEYHGPRSQMMRWVDHPTMGKDGSGWGARAGVSAVLLAARGFSGAPALTAQDPAGGWDDLGSRWLLAEQYFKPYPVCRWAQAPVEAVLSLRAAHGFTSHEIQAIEVISFHEATRLATSDPRNTEEAQYSTAFPAAVALVRGGIGPEDLNQATFDDPEVRRIAACLTISEDDHANETFPEQRLARAAITLKDGRRFESDWMNPRWDAQNPPSDQELLDKFSDLVEPKIGSVEAGTLANMLLNDPMPAPADILKRLSHAPR